MSKKAKYVLFIYDSIGEKIKLMRSEEQMTQIQLADVAGISLRGLQDIECGKIKNPREDTLLRISNVFNVDILCFNSADDLSRFCRDELLSLPPGKRMKTLRVAALKTLKDVVVGCSTDDGTLDEGIQTYKAVEAGQKPLETIENDLFNICEYINVPCDIYFGIDASKIGNVDLISDSPQTDLQNIPLMYQTIMTKLSMLNTTGLSKLIDYADDLTKIDKYIIH